jgi:hypothetical protein
MKRLLAVMMTFGAVALTAHSALADSPHFIRTPSCTKSLSSGLSCSGKAAGLGDGPALVFLTADSVTANYVCKNKGGNVAPGQPVVEQDVTGPTEQITPHNGQITFSATIPPPTPPSSATECPNGNWNVVLTSLTYTNVVLHIDDSSLTDLLTFDFGTIDP